MKSFKQFLKESSIKAYSYGSKYKMVPFESVKRGDMIFDINPHNNYVDSMPYLVKSNNGNRIEAENLGGPGFGSTLSLVKDMTPMIPAILDKSIAQKAADEWLEDTFGD